MIKVENISKQFGSDFLFEEINITLNPTERYGLIGANGTGKSTFMKILSGDIDPSSGKIKIDKNKRISTLKQNQFAYEEMKVIDCVIFGYKKLWEIKVERERLYSLNEMSEKESLLVADLEIEFAELGGYNAESDANKLLVGLGIDLEYHENKMSSLEPGLKLKVLLAQTLFGNPDILLLDEPTNNLDLNSIKWLESLLLKSDSTIVVISHDRKFLNNVCTNIADIDYGKISLYPGNYDDFMYASSQARQQLISENQKKSDKIQELKAFVRRFSANASKAKQATSRQNQIEKIKIVDIEKSSRVYPYIRFEQKTKIYSNLLEVVNLSKSYNGLKVLKNINFSVEVGERIGIIGSNGIGKTTLLNCLYDQNFKDSGDINWAINSEIEYFAQDSDEKIDSELSLIEWLKQYADPSTSNEKIRSILGRLLFSKDKIYKTMNILSGGEKRRMLFGKMMLKNPNVIILDEPTNHLDMESIESLNSALSIYDGTIIFTSHDREFISSLANRVFEMNHEKIIQHNQIPSDFLNSISG